MIEKTIYDYLSSANLSASVLMEIPENPPVKMVIIEKTGSGRSNLVNRATFAFKSYAGTLYEAAELNEEVKNALDAMPLTENVFSAKLNSDYNYTDLTNKKYRYQAIYDFTY